MLKDTSSPTWAQLRAEWQAECEAERAKCALKYNVETPAKAINLFWPKADTPAQALLLSVAESWLKARRRQIPTRREVAYHEAGHFVSAAVMGLNLRCAEIRGSKFGHDEWSGFVECWGDLESDSPAHDIRAEAVMVLAGAAAGTIFGEADPRECPAEIITACLLAVRLSEQTGMSLRGALTDVLIRTAKILHGLRDYVDEVADRLERGLPVNVFKGPTKKMLAAIQKISLDRVPDPSSEQVAELAKLITEAPVDLAALAHAVACLSKECTS